MGSKEINWKLLSGSRGWRDDSGVNILDPLNPDLSVCICRYGAGVKAIYDNIITNQSFPKCGEPKDDENVLSPKLGMGLYSDITYLYARADVVSKVDYFELGHSTWIGFVAVATDEGKTNLKRRDILICWRGTLFPAEWFNNFQASLTSASRILGDRPAEDPKVHEGFLSIYLSARDLVKEKVKQMVKQYKNEEVSITVTGHSLGAALATLNAVDIVVNGYNKPEESSSGFMVTAFVFASPKVGNSGFATVFNNQSNLHMLHIRHVLDPVPGVPPGNDYSKLGYVLDIYDIKKFWSYLPLFLYPYQMLSHFHGLDNYLDRIKATQGRRGRELEIKNLALRKLENGNWELYEKQDNA